MLSSRNGIFKPTKNIRRGKNLKKNPLLIWEFYKLMFCYFQGTAALLIIDKDTKATNVIENVAFINNKITDLKLNTKDWVGISVGL